jgi:PST family polysaccharide transporter
MIGCVWLSKSAFHSADYWFAYLLYGAFLSIISLNTIFAAVLNGFKQIKNLTIVNIVTSLSGIAFTVWLAYSMGIKGVLIAVNFTALVVFITNLFFISKIEGIHWRPSFLKWDSEITKLLLAFTLMGLVSGFATPAMQFLVRERILNKFTVVDAGCWQGVTRISDYYLAFITTVLSVYYLPRFSEINDRAEMRHEIFRGYKIILPVVGILALTIWLCKFWVVKLLFTNEFMPMLPLFKFQLLGDFLKIGSWLLGFIMIAKGLTKTFIITELIFSTLFVLLSYVLMDNFGVVGVTYAFCINYGIYWIVMWLLMKKYF